VVGSYDPHEPHLENVLGRKAEKRKLVHEEADRNVSGRCRARIRQGSSESEYPTRRVDRRAQADAQIGRDGSGIYRRPLVGGGPTAWASTPDVDVRSRLAGGIHDSKGGGRLSGERSRDQREA